MVTHSSESLQIILYPDFVNFFSILVVKLTTLDLRSKPVAFNHLSIMSNPPESIFYSVLCWRRSLSKKFVIYYVCAFGKFVLALRILCFFLLLRSINKQTKCKQENFSPILT